MPLLVGRRWEGNPGTADSRAARQSFACRAFVPDLIAAIDPQVSFHAVTAAFEAE